MPLIMDKNNNVELSSICCKAWESNLTQDVEVDNEGLSINGCCGGCYTIQRIMFCPFCGKPIDISEAVKED